MSTGDGVVFFLGHHDKQWHESEHRRALIDTDASRKNRMSLDVEIPANGDATLRIFDLTADDSNDYALSYAIDYLQETQQLQVQ